MKRKIYIVSIIIILVLAIGGVCLWNIVSKKATQPANPIIENVTEQKSQPAKDLTPTASPAANVQPVTPNKAADSTQKGDTQPPKAPTITIVPNDLFSYFSLTRDQVIQKFGKTFETVDTGFEKSCTGFYYKNAGLIFTFDDEENPNSKVAWIDCTQDIEINGAKSGMNFEQVQEKLGATQINEVSIKGLSQKLYELNYVINDCLITFRSDYKDGKSAILNIMRK